VRDEREYLNLFAHATPEHVVRGEASTWYFALPGMAQKIKSYNPDAKIIVILRNPVERAYSAWCHARADRLEPCEDFSAALALESQRGEVEFLLRYQRMGLYSAALEDYQAVFPPSQLLVLFYDDVRADPQSVWRNVCDFLGVAASHTPAFGNRYNRSGQPRNRLVHNLLRSHRVKRLVRSVLPHTLAMRAKQQVENMNLAQFPAMDSTCRVQLREYYRPDVQRLSGLTNRDLVAWLQ
jgi:Sulfotransferase family